MQNPNLSRRDFGMLTMAAVGGLVAGCSGDGEGGGSGGGGTALLTEGKHVCRGLNACKGKGAGGANACAGQGKCASADKHTCHEDNACKGQGGCGASAGINACKGKGECGVPLKADTWTKTRAKFEAAMTTAGKKFGAAPAAM